MRNRRLTPLVWLAIAALAALAIVFASVHLLRSRDPWAEYARQAERSIALLADEGYHRTAWSGWTAQQREVIDLVMPRLTAEPSDVMIWWRIVEQEQGHDVTAAVFYRLRHVHGRDVFIVPPTGGFVFNGFVPKDSQVVNLYLSTRTFEVD